MSIGSKGGEKGSWRPWVLHEEYVAPNAETAEVEKPLSDAAWAALILPLGLLLCVCFWQVDHDTTLLRKL
jgi:hypothetical protein